MKAILLSGAAALTCGLGLTASRAVAAEAEAAPGASAAVEEVVVTAQRRDERLQDVPIAVTSLDAQQIVAAGVVQTTDLGKVTPGLLTVQGSGFYVPYIRGIGARSITPGNESTVATYVDGIYQTDKQGLLLSGFSDVRSVQVLRGPQGTLFGRNATAGAVLVTTRGPSDDFTGQIEGTYGSDEYGGKLFVAGPIMPTLSASLAAFYRHEDNYIKNLNPANGAGDEVGSTRSKGVRGKIRWEPAPEFSAVLAADYVDARDEGPWAVQAISGTGPTLGEGVAAARGIAIPDIRSDRSVYAGEAPPLIHAEGWGQSLTMQLDTGLFTIKSITAHRNDESSGTLDLDGTPLPLFYFRTSLKSNVWQQEFTIASKGEGPLTWLGGFYYLRMRDGYQQLDQNVGIPFEYSPAVLATLPAGAAHIDQYSYVTIKSKGVFGEVGYDFTSRDKLTLGVRYTDEEHTLDAKNNSVVTIPNGAGGVLRLPPTTITGVCQVTPTCDGLSTPFSRWTYRAVLSHKFTDAVMAYASYNRGFKSGVYNISTVAAANLTATRPETVNAFEAGVKSQWLDRRLTLNAAAYYNDYKDLQVPVTTPGNNTQISINAAKAKISGLELEAAWRATENLTLQAGASFFFEAKYDSFPNCSVYTPNPNGGNITTSADCTGKRLPGTPDSFNLRADYRMPLGNGSSLTFNGLYAYTDDFDYAPHASEVTRAPKQDAIHTINLSATWRSADEHLYATLWGRDLADQDDVFRGLFTTNFGYTTTFTRGATYGVTLGYDF